jgi:hypothetical protein
LTARRWHTPRGDEEAHSRASTARIYCATSTTATTALSDSCRVDQQKDDIPEEPLAPAAAA